MLESQIARIEGSREYLLALRDAYRGHIVRLRLAGRAAEAKEYASLLAILEKGPPLDAGRPMPAPVKARAKIEQPAPPPAKDLFAPENNKRLGEARSLLARADQEYRGEHYARAGELYARAYEALPDVLGAASGRWGYCRLNGVTERLKQQDRPPSASELTSLEQEVRNAVGLAPALKPARSVCRPFNSGGWRWPRRGRRRRPSASGIPRGRRERPGP